MELETINKLFLELSQFATAKTNREIELEEKIKLLTPVQDKPKCESYSVCRNTRKAEEICKKGTDNSHCFV